MGLKILHSADWHLDSAFTSVSPEQRKLLRQEQQKLPHRILSLARQEGCQLVLLAGDIFDGTPGGDTLALLKQALAECGLPVLIAPGNHDCCAPGSPWLEEAWPENVWVFTGAMESVALPELDCRVWGAGYRSMDCPPLLENFHAQGEETWQIGLFHGDPVQKNSPYSPVTREQLEGSGLQYVALGHVHQGGLVRYRGGFCAWPGCPMGRGWDETGEKGVLLINLADPPQIQAVSLDTVRFYDLEGEENQILGQLPPAGSGDFYRITLTGERQTPLEQIRKSLSSFANLTLRDRREDPVELWTDVGEDTLRGLYFALLQEQKASLTAELSHKILAGREVELP